MREAGTLEMPKSVGHERPYGKPLVCTKKLKYAKIAQNPKGAKHTHHQRIPHLLLVYVYERVCSLKAPCWLSASIVPISMAFEGGKYHRHFSLCLCPMYLSRSPSSLYFSLVGFVIACSDLLRRNSSKHQTHLRTHRNLDSPLCASVDATSGRTVMRSIS